MNFQWNGRAGVKAERGTCENGELSIAGRKIAEECASRPLGVFPARRVMGSPRIGPRR